MALTISTNAPSLAHLNFINKMLAKHTERLSSGLRINSASDEDEGMPSIAYACLPLRIACTANGPLLLITSAKYAAWRLKYPEGVIPEGGITRK